MVANAPPTPARIGLLAGETLEMLGVKSLDLNTARQP
jgi:hypothetical protein